MKKILALVLAAIMLIALCACGGLTDTEKDIEKTPEPSSAGGDKTANGEEIKFEDTSIRICISLDPGNLGPFAANNTGRKQTLYETYQPLVEVLPGGQTRNVLAKEMHYTDEYTFVVEIWDNITDSDGNHITASDIVWNYTNEDWLAKSQTAKYIESVTALGDYEVEFKLNTTMKKGMERILYNWIVSQKAYEESSDKMAARPVGTGPYVMKDYVEGSYMVMEARDDYWKPEVDRTDVEQIHVKRIEYYVVSEAAQQVISLETDAIDAVSNMDSAQAARFENDPNYTVFDDVSNTTYTLFFNCDPSASTSNLAVRQAICYAIDAQGIIDGAMNGDAVKAYAFGSPLFDDILDSWNDGNYYEYNPEKAKELLENAGYKKGDVTVRFLLRSLELDQKIGLIIQGYLDAVGITCELNVYEETLAKTYAKDHSAWDIYLRNAGQDFLMVHGYNNDFSEKCWKDGIGYNGIHDEKLEELLQLCQENGTYTDEKMTELHYYMKDQAYVYGLFQPILYTVTKANTFEGKLLYNASYWLFPGACDFSWSK